MVRACIRPSFPQTILLICSESNRKGKFDWDAELIDNSHNEDFYRKTGQHMRTMLGLETSGIHPYCDGTSIIQGFDAAGKVLREAYTVSKLDR